MDQCSYDHLLRPGESAIAEPPEHGSQEWAYGCRFTVIQGSTHEKGDSVVIDIEPGGATEPVLITADITLTVKVLRGRGRIVLWNNDLGDRVCQAQLGEDSEPLVLSKGYAYYYMNDGPDHLILRDDSTPAFTDGDEVLLTAPPQPGRENGRCVQLPQAFWAGYIRQ